MPKTKKRLLLFFFTMLILFSILFLGYLSPIIKPFPKPGGPFVIGMQTMHFIDEARKDIYTPQEKPREVTINIWYPAELAQSTHTNISYLEGKKETIKTLFGTLYHLPAILTSLFFRNIDTHGFRNAPLNSKHRDYPVIIFFHGLLGSPSDAYLVILEELASNGYIIVGIDHPYFNIATILGDGSVVTSQKLAQNFAQMSPQEQQEFQTDAIDYFKGDMDFVVDQLAKLNENEQSIFYHHLDLNRIGIMGHSAGGTAALEFCRSNKQCKAVIDLDGWYDQIIKPEPIGTPTLLLFAEKSREISEPTEEYLKRKQLTKEQYYTREREIDKHIKQLCKAPNCSLVFIPGATHDSFGDGILFKWPFRGWQEPESYALLTNINSRIIHFFDQFLK